jgi:hypothetical protein
MVVPYFLTQLAEAHALKGSYDSALACLDDARRMVTDGGEAIASSLIDRTEAEVRQARVKASGDGADRAAIAALLDRARATARQQGAVYFERQAESVAAGRRN